MENAPLTIRQVSQKTGVTSKTLRYWESLGLLPKPWRSHTNYRQYRPSDVERVIFIRKAKSLGFTLSETRRIFELCHERGAPCEEVVDWAGEKIKTLENQIEALTQIRGRLIRYHQKWKRQGACPPMNPGEICCLIEEVPLSEITHAPQGR
jgi:DNA-binding transcriptional MerR regulator